ncbi:MAG TPA: plastocyanin/azurin family copper-binding protein [Nitrososphaeraceae archaeon]|nr:plastocyanin/azurin family copper-binding protein [Nitrososphaeraceae archaeon]
MSIYKLMTRKRFEFFGILIVAIISIATTPTSSNKIGGIISNYAQAQKEVKVYIVPGASTLADKAFSPNPVNVKVGDTVTWVNDDTQFHTVVSGNPSSGGDTGKVFDSGLSGPTALTTKGKTFSHVFTEKGEFLYFCQLHPTMIGKVIVS